MHGWETAHLAQQNGWCQKSSLKRGTKLDLCNALDEQLKKIKRVKVFDHLTTIY